MGIKLHQNKIALKILNEKNEAIILGEILHYIWEWILVYDRKILNINPETEKFNQKIESYIQKALAYYSEPLPQRNYIKKKVKEIIYNAFKSSEINKLKMLVCSKSVKIYKEVESFFRDKNEIQKIRPDIILSSPKEKIILEFKLHKDSEREEEQLKNYKKFLKKFFPDDNIRIYLITFEPLNITLQYVSKFSYSAQLKLFENFD